MTLIRYCSTYMCRCSFSFTIYACLLSCLDHLHFTRLLRTLRPFSVSCFTSALITILCCLPSILTVLIIIGLTFSLFSSSLFVNFLMREQTITFFTKAHFWFFFFFKIMLESWECGLYTSAAYTRVFTVISSLSIVFQL